MEPRFPRPISPEQRIVPAPEADPVYNPEVRVNDPAPIVDGINADVLAKTHSNDAKKFATAKQQFEKSDVLKTSSRNRDVGSNELIKKDWVDRAKQIVREYKDDPFTLQEQMEQLRGQYLKTQYDKQIGPRV
jgi:Txe/YoeB family toxin of Txe-Axe toxin-antitoxin module